MLTTLDRVKAQLLSNRVTAQVGEDSQLLFFIRVVSRRIEAIAGFGFAPSYKSKSYESDPSMINSNLNTFNTGDWILEPLTISVSGTAYTWGTNITGSPNESPYRVLRLMYNPYNYSTSWYPSSRTYYDAQDCIVIAGYYGYRTDYDQAWVLTGDSVQNNPLSASGTSITVSNVDGSNNEGYSPRFSPGNLIKFNDAVSGVYEIAEVLSVDTALNTMVVRRGQRGTTATAHVLNTTISTWATEPEVEQLAIRHAALMYAKKGSFNASDNANGTNTTYPPDLLPELYNTLDYIANKYQ